MKKTKSIKKIIEKGIRNGFEFATGIYKWEILELEDVVNEKLYIWVEVSKGVLNNAKFKVREILLSQEFAKAFWGDEVVCSKCGSEVPLSDEKEERCECLLQSGTLREYQYHLQQAVISDDIIKYYEDFL